jgi:GT2 family glycosyltransferase
MMPQTVSVSADVDDGDLRTSSARCESVTSRPTVCGKFLFVGDQKLYVRGVTYGAFQPDDQQREYGDIAQIDADFRQMADAGLNAVRIPHTMPPSELLDVAKRHGLRVMVGLSAEQFAGYLADPAKAPDIDDIIRGRVRTCKGHPALLCYALGNEIPASMVRWLGRRKVEQYLKHLYHVVKTEDPDALVTYVNYPSTEYLELLFLDFVSFNVYLESQERLASYLARLQNRAGDRPLLMSELGLDSLRNGAEKQASTLKSQIRTTFAAGCCGGFIFSWTDEWYRGGADVDDWAFGLTDRARRPKPALAAVQRAFSEVPVPWDLSWPKISVVVCVYNGERTIRDCCQGLTELDYPNYEVIVIDDGSTDGTAEIVTEYPFVLIRTANRGLGEARNRGLAAASGEIVAYTDGDARPDRQWLTYLAAAFRTTPHVGIGGWNLAPAGDGWVADCVASAPGGPVHVLVSDREAEHIPGCSMAFRKDALMAIGGFDPQFRTAGDDVDVCWRLQDRGWTLGFAHGAMVSHHHRNSVGAYWRQQLGYGQAEAMLERKWPERYNVFGHLAWGGRLYGRGLTLPLGRAGRIYRGVWGLAPFQWLTEPEPSLLSVLPLMPEWYLAVTTLALVSLDGLIWHPLFVAGPLCLVAIAAPIVRAVVSASKARFTMASNSRLRRALMYTTVAVLHLLQPLARLRGRLRDGLTIWRQRGAPAMVTPLARTFPLRVTRYRPPQDWLRELRVAMKDIGGVVLVGGDYDRWDFEVRGGIFGSSRLLMAFEDTGSGTQLVRVRAWPYCHWFVTLLPGLLTIATVAAGVNGANVTAASLGFLATSMVWRIVEDCGITMGTIHRGLMMVGLFQPAAEERASNAQRAISPQAITQPSDRSPARVATELPHVESGVAPLVTPPEIAAQLAVRPTPAKATLGTSAMRVMPTGGHRC